MQKRGRTSERNEQQKVDGFGYNLGHWQPGPIELIIKDSAILSANVKSTDILQQRQKEGSPPAPVFRACAPAEPHRFLGCGLYPVCQKMKDSGGERMLAHLPLLCYSTFAKDRYYYVGK